MSYLVLARKWRPQTLADVLGQEHVTQTLRNAIDSGRIAQTFLFSGPRGTGKTSAARIFAKALCCEAQDGPTPDPCGVCGQCVAIQDNTSTDVVEMDAASNTQVDRVRETIIDSVRYSPASARYRVYIIDEVHMLSVPSFNALLKTFEEPPEHVKFILCTTELHKIPITIQSRCQRYDFRLVSADKIADRLAYILQQEKISYEAGALSLVARFADGSMRDAQSILEQVLAFAAGRTLDGATVRAALGVTETKTVEAVISAILERRPEAIFARVAEVYARGESLGRFAASLLEYARDLVVAKLVKAPQQSIQRPSDEIERLVSQAEPYRAQTLERLFDFLSRVQDEVARSPQPRFALEVGLCSLAHEPAPVPVEELLTRLAKFEQALGRGQALPGAPQPEPTTPPRNPVPPSFGSAVSAQSASPSPPSPSGPPPSPPSASAPPSSPGRSDPSPGPPGPSGPPSASRGSASRVESKTDAGPHPEAHNPSEEVRYRAFVSMVQKRRPALGASLFQVRPLRFERGGVHLACETAFDFEKLRQKDAHQTLQKALLVFFGEPVELSVTRAQGRFEGPKTLNEADDAAKAQRVSEKEGRARSRPAVKAVEQELGATIARVRVLGEEES